jgi:hypothetical protein
LAWFALLINGTDAHVLNVVKTAKRVTNGTVVFAPYAACSVTNIIIGTAVSALSVVYSEMKITLLKIVSVPIAAGNFTVGTAAYAENAGKKEPNMFYV